MNISMLIQDVTPSERDSAEAILCSMVAMAWSLYSVTLVAENAKRSLATLSHEHRAQAAEASFRYVMSGMSGANPFRIALERYIKEVLPTATELSSPPPLNLLGPGSAEVTVETIKDATRS